jgi:hypothetical protein
MGDVCLGPNGRVVAFGGHSGCRPYQDATRQTSAFVAGFLGTGVPLPVHEFRNSP